MNAVISPISFTIVPLLILCQLTATSGVEVLTIGYQGAPQLIRKHEHSKSDGLSGSEVLAIDDQGTPPLIRKHEHSKSDATKNEERVPLPEWTHGKNQVLLQSTRVDDPGNLGMMRTRMEASLKSKGVLSHDIAGGKGFLDGWVFLIGFAFFSIGACTSLVIESKRLSAEPAAVSRDNFLDIAKYILICLVAAQHLDFGYPATSQFQKIWEGIDMPAFFIISGIVTKWGDSYWPRLEMLRNTFRDCMLSDALWMLCVTCPPFPGSTACGLWFLLALGLYRVGLGFMFHLHARSLGPKWGGLLILMESIALTWVWMHCGRSALIPAYPHTYEANCVVVHAPFYILGLIIQSHDLLGYLKTPAAFVAAVIALGAWGHVVMMMKPAEENLEGGWLSPIALGDYHENEDIVAWPPMWLWTVAMKGVLALALISLAVPLTRATAVSNCFARLGRRSVYGYVLQITILHGVIGWGTGIESLGKLYAIHPGLAVVGVGFSMAVLCSPLAEASFSWLMCPEWALPRRKSGTTVT